MQKYVHLMHISRSHWTTAEFKTFFESVCMSLDLYASVFNLYDLFSNGGHYVSSLRYYGVNISVESLRGLLCTWLNGILDCAAASVRCASVQEATSAAGSQPPCHHYAAISPALKPHGRQVVDDHVCILCRNILYWICIGYSNSTVSFCDWCGMQDSGNCWLEKNSAVL